MNKKIIFIILIFLSIFISLGYTIKYKNNVKQYQLAQNQKIKKIYNKELLGSELISIINKAIDFNRNIENNKEIKFLNEEKFNEIIKIDVKFKDLKKNISMERINEIGIKKFVKNFGSFIFKCVEIDFYEENGQVKYMLFEEI